MIRRQPEHTFVLWIAGITVLLGLSLMYGFPVREKDKGIEPAPLGSRMREYLRTDPVGNVFEKDLVKRVYVIPGGGPGPADAPTPGYPEWTRRRTEEAWKLWLEDSTEQGTGLFLALSAGSLNGANSRDATTGQV